MVKYEKKLSNPKWSSKSIFGSFNESTIDIIKIAQDIDTLEISNLPFEDCCTIFTPKAPKTRPRLEKIKSYEARDDYSELIEETLASVKTYLFDKNGQVITKDISEDKVVKEDFSDLL